MYILSLKAFDAAVICEHGRHWRMAYAYKRNMEAEYSVVIEDSEEYCSDFMLQLGFMKLFIGLMLIKFAVICNDRSELILK